MRYIIVGYGVKKDKDVEKHFVILCKTYIEKSELESRYVYKVVRGKIKTNKYYRLLSKEVFRTDKFVSKDKFLNYEIEENKDEIDYIGFSCNPPCFCDEKKFKKFRNNFDSLKVMDEVVSGKCAIDSLDFIRSIKEL